MKNKSLKQLMSKIQTITENAELINLNEAAQARLKGGSATSVSDININFGCHIHAQL